MGHQENMTHQRSFLKKVLIVLWALFITGVLIILTFLVLDNLILPAYVRKYEITEVPYVVGLDYPQALDSLKARKLLPEVYGQGRFVVRTEPEAGMLVKENRIVRVYLGDSLPQSEY